MRTNKYIYIPKDVPSPNKTKQLYFKALLKKILEAFYGLMPVSRTLPFVLEIYNYNTTVSFFLKNAL